LGQKTNDQWDFLEFVKACINRDHLKEGDYLVVDNASIHGGLDSLDKLLEVLEEHGHIGVFTCLRPNPCELVFSILKAHLRNCRNNIIPICLDVMCGLAKVTYLKLLAFYDKCIYFENICNTALDLARWGFSLERGGEQGKIKEFSRFSMRHET